LLTEQEQQPRQTYAWDAFVLDRDSIEVLDPKPLMSRGVLDVEVHMAHGDAQFAGERLRQRRRRQRKAKQREQKSRHGVAAY
jgi:hypothetical protein